MNFCPNCGEKLLGKKKYCSNCGHNVQGLAKKSNPTPKDFSKLNTDDLGNSFPSESLPIDKSRNDLFEKKIKKKKEFVLPKIYKCSICRVKLELENQERREGEFICPKCGSITKENEYSSDSNSIEQVDTAYSGNVFSNEQNKVETSESETWQLTTIEDRKEKESEAEVKKLILPESFNCPQCGIELILEKKERLERKFICPNCSSDVSIPSNSKCLVASNLSGANSEQTIINRIDKEIDSIDKSLVELAFEDKAWILLGSMISMGLVGFGMFIYYRIDGFKKKSNQALFLAFLGLLALFFFGLFNTFMGIT